MRKRLLFFLLVALLSTHMLRAQSFPSPYAYLREAPDSVSSVEPHTLRSDSMPVVLLLCRSAEGDTLWLLPLASDKLLFLSVDPLADKYPGIQPYLYCAGNPLRYIDPDGEDIYRYDEETGNFNLEIPTNDNFDQIGVFAYNEQSGRYELQRDGNGNLMTFSAYMGKNDQIAKGILRDGRNFLRGGGYIPVGGSGEPTIQDVQQFMLILDNVTGREISAYGMSSPYKSVGGMVWISPYLNNTAVTSETPIRDFSPYQVQSHFHTHGQATNYIEATLPSPKYDIPFKNRISELYPNIHLYILHNYGQPIKYY